MTLALGICPARCGAAGDDVPTYNRDVLPILANRCFACHGPDSGARQADLRLDIAEAATEWVIIPGDAASSELVRRIASSDPDKRMPPADSKKPALSAAEVKLFRRWIDAGAK